MNNISMLIAKDLELNVAWFCNIFFNEHRSIAKG